MISSSSSIPSHCPHCGTLLDYDKDGILYSHAVGVEVRGVYDGVLFWQCPACDGRWHHFQPGSRLFERAEEYVLA